MTAAEPALLSVNVGMPARVPWQGREIFTGLWKRPVDGPVMVRRLNLDGDGQGDLAGHGGEQRAVLVYQIQSYWYWQRYFGRDDLGYGLFGENLTVDGLPDDQVCIGDQYRIGDAEFEVTQPRVTCYRVSLRLGVPELPSLLVSQHRPGFYMRVLREGQIKAGDRIRKTRAGPGALTVADTDALLYLPGKDPVKLRLAAQLPALSPGWQESFRALLPAGPPGAAGGGPPRPAWTGFRPLRVTRVVAESATVSSVYLAAADGSSLPAAKPGQYLTLRVPAAGQPAPVRSYSLSARPGTAYYRISVKHEPHGSVSSYLTTRLAPGTVLDAAAPRGDFVLAEDDGRPVLLLSAGIGVTPLLSMLHQLAATRSERVIWWVHVARGPREHPLATEAHELIAALPQASEHVFYTAASPPERHRARAAARRPDKHSLAALGVSADSAAYICGPSSFMTEMQETLEGLGIARTRLHTELFGTLSRVNPGVTSATTRPPHPPPGAPGTGPLVTFARSGLAARFPAGQGSVLELAEDCDVPTRWSCRTGVCHTCETPLLAGDVTYAPEPLAPPADGQVLVCCARPETDIVLDM